MVEQPSIAALAFAMLVHADPELVAIIVLSLKVSVAAAAIGFALGLPVGAALAMLRFPGRGALVLLTDTLLGLPPVVVGLAVYLALSRSGPFGAPGLLFTPAAMVIAQACLTLPIAAHCRIGRWRSRWAWCC